jgi:hypothetical protein
VNKFFDGLTLKTPERNGMQVDIPVTIESIVSLLGFAGAVMYQSAMLKSSLKNLGERIATVEKDVSDRIEKVEVNLSKITEILLRQENQAVKLDIITKTLDNLGNKFERHERWHEEYNAYILSPKITRKPPKPRMNKN